MKRHQVGDVVYANRAIVSENVDGVKGKTKVNAEKGDALKVLTVCTQALYPYRVTKYDTWAEAFWVSADEIDSIPHLVTPGRSVEDLAKIKEK